MTTQPLWMSNRTREAELRRLPLARPRLTLTGKLDRIFNRHPLACSIAVMAALAALCAGVLSWISA